MLFNFKLSILFKTKKNINSPSCTTPDRNKRENDNKHARRGPTQISHNLKERQQTRRARPRHRHDQKRQTLTKQREKTAQIKIFDQSKTDRVNVTIRPRNGPIN